MRLVPGVCSTCPPHPAFGAMTGVHLPIFHRILLGVSTKIKIETLDRRWLLSRYDEKLLLNKKTTVAKIASEYEDNQGMIFGILEANDGSIWSFVARSCLIPVCQ